MSLRYIVKSYAKMPELRRLILDGRKYVIRNEPDDPMAAAGVEIEINGKSRRFAVEFDTRKCGKLTDCALIEKAMPLLNAWEDEERAKTE